ncbi:MAG: YccF domain-containing protein [Alphaproteobacteria bacterium]
MSTIGNILWVIFGGLMSAISWCLAGVIMAITIIGLPWARACFTIANFSLFPFGREAINRRDLTGYSDIGTGLAGLIGNILWFILAGIWLAIGHVVIGCLFCITIIGIPFGLQHFKLAGISLAPIGKTIVDKRTMRQARGYRS